MDKLKKNRIITNFIIVYSAGILMNVWVFVKLWNILRNPFIRGAFQLKLFSAEQLADAMRIMLKLDLVPIELKLIPLLQIIIGVYMFITFWGVCRDINIVCERYDNGAQKSPNYLIVMLLSGLTMGIYYLFWIYRQGNRLSAAGQKCYGKELKETGSSYVMFSILGIFTLRICSCVCAVKLLKNLNLILETYYNRQDSEKITDSVHSQQDMDRFNEDSVTVPAEDWMRQEKELEGRMECCSGMYEGAVFPVGAEEIIIGRDESKANVIIKNPKISRCHCGVRYNQEDGNYIVTDYSTNGTFYKNGQRFENKRATRCHSGTIFVIAQTGNEFLLK